MTPNPPLFIFREHRLTSKVYSSLPNLVLGFHGCDKAVGEKVLSSQECLMPSENEYDWMGHCLNLLEAKSIEIVKQGFETFLKMQESSGFQQLPENKKIEDGFPMLRRFDCAVMQTIHAYGKEDIHFNNDVFIILQ